VTIAFINPGEPKSGHAVRRFAFLLGIIITGLFVIAGFTPAGTHIFTRWIRVDAEIAYIAKNIIKIAAVLPLITVFTQHLTGKMMKNRTTRPLSRGKAINLSALALV